MHFIRPDRRTFTAAGSEQPARDLRRRRQRPPLRHPNNLRAVVGHMIVILQEQLPLPLGRKEQPWQSATCAELYH